MAKEVWSDLKKHTLTENSRTGDTTFTNRLGVVSITISEDKNKCIKLIGRNVLKDQKSEVVK